MTKVSLAVITLEIETNYYQPIRSKLAPMPGIALAHQAPIQPGSHLQLARK